MRNGKYDCGPEPYDGATSRDQQSCGGGCDRRHTGAPATSATSGGNGHKGLDRARRRRQCVPGRCFRPVLQRLYSAPSKPPPPPPPPSAKVQAEKTRDSILAGITDESLKKKAKLLADAAIGGNAIKLTAKLTAPDAARRAQITIKRRGSQKPGACVATAAAGGRRRRLAAAAYTSKYSSARRD